MKDNQIEQLAEEKYPDEIRELDHATKGLIAHDIKKQRAAFIAGYTAANKGVGMKLLAEKLDVAISMFLKVDNQYPNFMVHELVDTVIMPIVSESQSPSDQSREVQEEIKRLRELQANKTRWFSQEEFDRLQHLVSLSPSQPLPDATKDGIDWDAIQQEFEDNFLGGTARDVFNWFRSRPEFQLRQGDEKVINKMLSDLNHDLRESVSTVNKQFFEGQIYILEKLKVEFKKAPQQDSDGIAVGFAEWIADNVDAPHSKHGEWKIYSHGGKIVKTAEELYTYYLNNHGG